MAGWGPKRCVHLLLLHSSTPIIPLLLRSARRRTEWWVIRRIHDRSGLTSSSHLLWRPRVSCCRRARSGLLRLRCTKKCTHLSSDIVRVIHATTEHRHALPAVLQDLSPYVSYMQMHLSFPFLFLCLSISSTSHFLILSPSPSVSINHSRAAPAD